jgi:hypothetical protein
MRIWQQLQKKGERISFYGIVMNAVVYPSVVE